MDINKTKQALQNLANAAYLAPMSGRDHDVCKKSVIEIDAFVNESTKLSADMENLVKRVADLEKENADLKNKPTEA